MEVLFEDNHLIAINKQTSDIVQPDKSNDISLEEKIKTYLKQKYQKPGDVFLGVVHRIDRPVSGVVLFARTSKALARLNQMFQDKSVKKIYWAIVKEQPPKEADTLIHYIVRDTRKNKSFAYDKEVKESKKAILHYKILDKSDNYYLLEIQLETGRHHQIRCQLSKIGCPIRGDLKYGYNRSLDHGGINLHARKISFTHPVKNEPVEIVANVPEDKLWKYFENRNK
ncbi:MAG TPA: RluA family pseudouridine synthase [Bacteroidales bacterium]|nr:RluA family pseudouridine synthase [Bacteroidales bacterium]